MKKDLLSRVISILSIDSVILRESSIKCKDDFRPNSTMDYEDLTPEFWQPAIVKPKPLNPPEFEIVDDLQGVAFEYKLGARLTDCERLLSRVVDDPLVDDEETVFLEIMAVFSAQYVAPKDADLELLRPTLEEFARVNVGYHVWPYWHEYLQSTCCRMGFPPFPLGFYTPPEKFFVNDSQAGKASKRTPRAS